MTLLATSPVLIYTSKKELSGWADKTGTFWFCDNYRCFFPEVQTDHKIQVELYRRPSKNRFQIYEIYRSKNFAGIKRRVDHVKLCESIYNKPIYHDFQKFIDKVRQKYNVYTSLYAQIIYW